MGTRHAGGCAARWKNGGRDVLIRVGEVSVAAGLAGLTVIGLCAWTLHGSEPADAKARATAGLSV